MPLTPEELEIEEQAADAKFKAVSEGKEDPGKEAGRKIGALARSGTKLDSKAVNVPTDGEPPPPKNELNPEGLTPEDVILRTIRAATDTGGRFADTVTGGMLNKGVSMLPGAPSLPELNTMSDEQNLRLGKMGAVPDAAALAAQSMLIPGGATAGFGKAAATGGALAGGGAVAEALGQGENIDPNKVAMATGMGAVGGTLGKYVGDRLGRLLERHMGDSPTKLWEQAGKQFQTLKGETDAAAKAMVDSGVKVDSGYLKRGADLLEQQLNKKILFRTDQLPFAKAALETVRKTTDDGAALKLTDINDIRRSIRDSITDTNGAWRDAVTPQDARLVQQIDRQIAKLMQGLPNNKTAVVAGDAKKGIDAFNKMNASVPVQRKAGIIASAFDNADLNTTGGLPFDRALQNEFKKIYQSRMGKAEFKGKDLALIREGASGNFGTRWLNSLDRAYGHGGLFSFVWNSVNKIPRAGANRAAETNARALFESLTQKELGRAGAKGGAAGTVFGAEAGKSLGELMGPVQIQSPIVPGTPR